VTREEHHAIDLKLFHRFGPDGVREGSAQLGHEDVDVLIVSEGDGATERERLWSPSRIVGDALRLCQRVAEERDIVFELWVGGPDGGLGRVAGWHARFKHRGGVAGTAYGCESPALACSRALGDLPTRSGAPWV